jgi:hypothetical protein
VLNVRKLEALRPLAGHERTEYWDVGLRAFPRSATPWASGFVASRRSSVTTRTV